MFFLILGIILGVVAVLFFIQNTAVVTVMFSSWQLEGSLALILILTFITGIVITLLVLLPSFIEDALSLSAARRRIKALESDLEAAKNAQQEAEKQSPSPDVIIVTE